ncbi:hypothetical protein BGC31_14885 [Komagataeibacter xylinus]|nr:hypothetical protein H845_1150 [Komagataeibacter xylinus E25]RFP01772.1 hypothetical protein BGC31_14885 [Komagataeibacter xylinus]RFP05872.1 hypothetical protein BFX83_13010 [Komagataeibacter xylinus]
MTPRPSSIQALPASAWKNGQGMTRPVAEAPGWRVSIATIDRSCAYSAYPGLQRQQALLSGAGLELVLPTRERMQLACAGRVLSFSGAVPLDCQLLGGTVTVLNIMFAPDSFPDAAIRSATTTFFPNAGADTVIVPVRGSWRAVCANNTVHHVATGEILRGAVLYIAPLPGPGLQSALCYVASSCM